MDWARVRAQLRGLGVERGASGGASGNVPPELSVTGSHSAGAQTTLLTPHDSYRLVSFVRDCNDYGFNNKDFVA